jgi:hypothetical protein
MRLWGAVIVAAWAASAAAQDGKEKKPSVARVTVVDTVTGFSMLGEDAVEYRLQAPPKGDLMADSVYVQAPRDKAPKGFFGRAAVVAEGKLTLGQVAVGFAGKNPLKAATLRVLADRVEVVTDKNKKDVPAAGTAVVRGRLVEGKFAAGPGEMSSWAVENGERPIVLVGELVGKEKRAPGPVRAAGKLRLLRPGNVIILQVEELKAEDGR